MTEVTAQALHRQSSEAAMEEPSLQTSAKRRQRGCRRYVLRQTVPHVCGGDRKSSVADGWQTRTALLVQQPFPAKPGLANHWPATFLCHLSRKPSLDVKITSTTN